MSNFKFSQRTGWSLASNQLMSTLDELRRQKQPIIDLTESNPTRCGFSYPGKKILNWLSIPENMKYDPSPKGGLRAREAIKRYYEGKGITVSADQIFLTASTSEGYSNLFRLLTDPGDHVLFPSPSYPLFEFLVDLNDIQMDSYRLVYQHGWAIDFNSLKNTIGGKTRAIIMVSPNNPTGSFLKQHDIDQLNSICKKYDLPLICDEVFSDYIFDHSQKYLSLAGNQENLTFVLGGLSKTLALPQMKLSWIVINGPPGLVEQAMDRLEIISDTFLSVNTPVQNSLGNWLALKNDIQANLKSRLEHNLSFLTSELKEHLGCGMLKNEAGWYAIVKIPTLFTEEQWVLKFLREDHVFTHPGYFFNFEDEAYIVLSLLPEEKYFQEGVRRVLKRIESASL